MKNTILTFIFSIIFTVVLFGQTQINYDNCNSVKVNHGKPDICDISAKTTENTPYVIQIGYYTDPINSHTDIIRWEYGDGYVYTYRVIFNSYHEAKTTLPYIKKTHCESAFVTKMYFLNVKAFQNE